MSVNETSRLFKIRDWNDLYEVHQSRRPTMMFWVPMTNRMGEDGYIELMGHPSGAAFLGAWTAIVFVASRCVPRGHLIRSTGVPHTLESINRISRIPLEILREAIPFFIHEINWLEEVEFAAAQDANASTEPVKPNGHAPRIITPFDEWWKVWTEGTRQTTDQAAAQNDFMKYVTPGELEACMVCLRDFVMGDRTIRGIGIPDPQNWIRKHAKDNWSARWQRPKKSRGQEVEENLQRMHR